MMVIFEKIINIPLPVYVLEGGLILIGLFLVLMPDSAQKLFPFGLQGKARRYFSWFFLFFAVSTLILAVYYGLRA